MPDRGRLGCGDTPAVTQGSERASQEHPTSVERTGAAMTHTLRLRPILVALAAVLLSACPGGPSPTITPPAKSPSSTAPPALSPPVTPPITHAGCFMLSRFDGSESVTVHPEDCARATLPASTFKIPHALIALQTGVVTDVDGSVDWDGTRYPEMKAWERDHNLTSAIRDSVVWYFQRTAKAVGRERMQAWLETLHYGNADASGSLTEFWLDDGSLVITAPQQLDFWGRMVRGELAIDSRHVDTVMSIVEAPIDFWQGRLPAGESPPPSTATLHAKTGTGSTPSQSVTWWVGTVDGPRGKWLFVSRVISAGPYAGFSPAVREGMHALAQAAVL